MKSFCFQFSKLASFKQNMHMQFLECTRGLSFISLFTISRWISVIFLFYCEVFDEEEVKAPLQVIYFWKISTQVSKSGISSAKLITEFFLFSWWIKVILVCHILTFRDGWKQKSLGAMQKLRTLKKKLHRTYNKKSFVLQMYFNFMKYLILDFCTKDMPNENSLT